jgi:hypothetical protein
MSFKIISTFIIWSILGISLYAQDLGNSPYSQIALGDLSPAGNAQQSTMGGGVSFVMPFTINPLNPASVSRLAKSKNTIYEAGAILQLKELAQKNANQRDFAGSLAYLAIAFPVSKYVGASMGLRPLTSVRYENTVTRPIQNSDFVTDISYSGNGGLTSVYVDLGLDLTKNFRADTSKHRLGLGIRVSYIFGSIIEEASSKIRTGQLSDDVRTSLYQRNRWSDVLFEPALLYTYKLNKTQKLNVGATLTIGRDLRTYRFLSIERYQSNSATLLGIDTLYREAPNKVHYPQKIQLGISWEKDLKLAITSDFFVQNWQNYQSTASNTNQRLAQSWGVGLGMQYIPEFYAVKNIFWRRNFYRAGFTYQQTPIIANNGQNVNDIAFNFGVGIPIVVQKSFSIVNLGFALGRRGSINNELVRENYFRINLGVTINDRWFEKFRLN